jgi:DNA replication protein DnaC
MKRLDEILRMNRSAPASSDASTSSPAADRRPFPIPADEEEACQECGGAGFLRRELPLGHPDFGKAVLCRCVEEESAESRRDRLQRYSSLGPLTRLTFANLIERGRSVNPRDQEQFRRLVLDAKAFAEEPEGWMLVHGASGAGKTHVAAAIANRCIERGQPALFVVVPDLLDHLRAAYNPGSELSYDSLFDQVRNAPVLILDDLGTQNSTSWAQEKLFQVLNHRYNSRLPTVVTTNLTLERLDERLRMRLTDPELSRAYHVEAHAPPTDLGGLDALGLPRISEMTFDAFDVRLPHLTAEQRLNVEGAYRMALQFAEQPEDWLVFEGGHGCGKTHLAAAIANNRRARGEHPLFVVVPDLLDFLRHTMERDSRLSFFEAFDAVRGAPLLVLDDLGAQSDIAWVRDRLFQLINYRYAARLPTVFTVSRESLERLEERILARLYDPNISTEVPIIAPAYRVDFESPRAASSRAGRQSSSRTPGRPRGSPPDETRPSRGSQGRQPPAR